MKFLSTLSKVFEKHSKYRTLNVLRSMTQQQRDDIGISTELLERGIDGWPWQKPEPNNAGVLLKSNVRMISTPNASALVSSNQTSTIEKTAA